VHEANTEAAGSKPGRWRLAWARQLHAPNLFGSSTESSAPHRRVLTASRMIAVFAVCVVAAGMFAGVAGFRWARQSDEQLLLNQHAALRNTIGEFRALVGRSGEIDPRLLRVVEGIVGLKNLKFESAPRAS
jgi:hypothetical protein